MSTLKLFFRDTIIYGLATVLPRVINFLLVKIQTDALSTQSYADNTYFYIWAGLFSVLLTFGIETAFFRFYKLQKKKAELVSTAFITLIIMVVLFITTMFIFSDFFIKLFDFQNNILRYKLWISILAFDTLAVIPFAYLRITNKPIKYTSIKLFNVGVIVVIQVLFLTIIPAMIKSGASLPEIIQLNYTKIPKVNYIFISNVLGSACSFILLLPILFKFSWKFNSNLLGKMVNYSWPIMVAGIAYIINENLDKYLLKDMLGKSEMGIYAAAYKLAIFMNLYIQAFRLGAEPFFFNNADKKNAKQTYAIILNYFVIIGSIVLLVIVSYIDVIKHFINARYWSGLVIVPIVLLANLFLGIYHNLSIWYKLTDKTRFGMYFSLLGASITIFLNLFLIPRIGFIASAWATLSAYAVMMICSYFIGKKHYKVPYNIKKVTSYLLISVGLSFISFYYFRDNFLISTTIIIIYLLFTLWSEKDILQKTLLK